MSDCSYRMAISGSGEGLASLIISKVSHFPAAGLAIIIGRVAPGDTALMAWATKHRKRRPVARDDVELEIVYGNQTTRKISIKKAAVLGYTETYDAANGLGRFELVIQQHCFGDKEHCYVPVPQKDGSLLHVVYRLDLLCLDFLDELAGLKRAPGSSITHPFADNEWSQPPALPQCLHFPTDWAIPLSISFNLIRWDQETVHGQLELDLTTDLGRELLGTRYPVIQDRIGQLIADGYRAKDVLLEERSQTVGSKTVKCDLAEWYQVSAGEKRMKITATRIKLEYNNIRPKTTKGSGIPGVLEFVKVTAAAAVATAQAEAAPVAEALTITSKAEKPTTVSSKSDEFKVIKPVSVKISRSKYPESSQHIEDAIKNGHPSILTIKRPGAKNNRRAALKGFSKVPGKDLDEYPPAMFEEGGKNASVRPISPSDNRGAGSSMGHKLRPYPDGTKVRFEIED